MLKLLMFDFSSGKLSYSHNSTLFLLSNIITSNNKNKHKSNSITSLTQVLSILHNVAWWWWCWMLILHFLHTYLSFFLLLAMNSHLQQFYCFWMVINLYCYSFWVEKLHFVRCMQWMKCVCISFVWRCVRMIECILCLFVCLWMHGWI